MYDKDEINSVAILYSVDPKVQNFEMLLKVLSPMIDYVLVKHPDVQEHWEDVKQEVLTLIWDNCSSVIQLRKLFKYSVPADYFYFKIREWVFRECRKMSGMYDMYNPLVKSYVDMNKKEKNMLNAELEDELWDN